MELPKACERVVDESEREFHRAASAMLTSLVKQFPAHNKENVLYLASVIAGAQRVLHIMIALLPSHEMRREFLKAMHEVSEEAVEHYALSWTHELDQWLAAREREEVRNHAEGNKGRTRRAEGASGGRGGHGSPGRGEPLEGNTS